VIDALGPAGAVFHDKIRSVQVVDSYSSRLLDVRRRFNPNLSSSVIYEWIVDAVAGVLDGVGKAINSGLLTSIEDRVASDIYGDVLGEANVLLNASHLSCAALLARVALESGLRRVAHREQMPGAQTAKAGAINIWLWKNNNYPKATFELVESCLAPGNDFAHSTKDAERYTHGDIAKTIGDVRSLLATHLA
jgi:hypothetical protein